MYVLLIKHKASQRRTVWHHRPLINAQRLTDRVQLLGLHIPSLDQTRPDN